MPSIQFMASGNMFTTLTGDLEKINCLFSDRRAWGETCGWTFWNVHRTYAGCQNTIPQTGRLKQQPFIFPQLWRLKVRAQGATRTGFW